MPRPLPASVIAVAGQPSYRWLFDGPASGFQRDTANAVDCYRSVANRGYEAGGALTRTAAAGANAPVQSSIGGRLAASFGDVGGAGRAFVGPPAAGSPMAALHDPNTYCTVVAMLSVTALGGIDQRPLCLTKSSTAGASRGVLFYIDTANAWRLRVGNGTGEVVNAGAAAATGKSRIAIRKQLLAYDVKRNDAALLSGTAASLVAGDGSAQTIIGAGSTSGANNFEGLIGEINIWLGTTSATALTDSLLTDMDNYLIAAWGS